MKWQFCEQNNNLLISTTILRIELNFLNSNDDFTNLMTNFEKSNDEFQQVE